MVDYICECFSRNISSLLRKMAKRKEHPAEKRAQIIILQKQGHSYRKIAQILKVSLGAVQKAIERHRETGVNTVRKRSGRP